VTAATAPAPARESATAAIPLASLLDVGVLAVLTVIGVVGFASSFDTLVYLWAGIGGVVVGAGAALLAHWLRLPAVLTALVALLLFFLLGGAIAVPGSALFRVVPTLDTVEQLSVGAVFGWADLVTLRAPVSLPEYVATIPYLTCWLVMLVGTSLATRWLPQRRRTAGRMLALLVGPLLVYLAGVLLGTDQPVLAAARGIAFAGIALVWLGRRRSRLDGEASGGRSGALGRRVAGVAIVVAGALVLGGVVGALVAPSPQQRFVLREVVQPPFQPLDYASPLSGFRKYTKDEADTTLFTVEGMRDGDRLRLAAMDSYTGVLWNVAGSKVATDGSGSFALVGRHVPEPTFVTPAETSEIRVTVEDYADVWVPEVGYPTSLSFTGPDGADQDEALRVNPATGTTVLTTGLSSGDSYEMTGVVQEQPDPKDLEDVPVASLDRPPMSNVPDVIVSKAQEFAGDATTPVDKLVNIQTALRTQGFLSHGSASDSVRSRAGHGADRMVELLTRAQMVGDQEQYATAFALMADSLGYPARVVMGYAPENVVDGSPTEVHGSDVTAWAEVAFDGVGWVAFDATPEQTDVPQDQDPKPQSEPQPQVRQPPRSDNDRDDLVTKVEADSSDDDDPDAFAIPGWVIALALGILIPLAILLAPVFVLVIVKGRRAARRRGQGPGDRRVAGAWEELVDRMSELGYSAAPGTRRMTAAGLEAETGAPLGGLATLTDEAVFSGREVGDEAVDRAWQEMEGAVGAARERAGRGRRLLSRYRLSALRSWWGRTTSSAVEQAQRRLSA